MTAQQTISSFEWQWNHLSDDPSPYLLDSPYWREHVATMILDELGVTADSLKGKLVLDVGCGQGRWALGFEQLRCSVFGIDPSHAGVMFAVKHGLNAGVLNLFDIPNSRYELEGKFDIVWCWGVIHHTPNPELAFQIVASCAKTGGLIHCYVYSHPRGLKMKLMRLLLKPFNFATRLEIIKVWLSMGLIRGTVHGWFDALSPSINREISETTVRDWCGTLKLEFERKYPQWADGRYDLFFNAKN